MCSVVCTSFRVSGLWSLDTGISQLSHEETAFDRHLTTVGKIADCLSLMTEPQADIITACLSGDRSAQQQLYELHNRCVYRLCVRLVGGQDASDVTQQTFLKVFRTIQQFSGGSRFETWLHRVTVNECLQHTRSRNRRPEVALATEPVAAGSTPGAASESSELLQAALNRLEPDLRTVFVLREIEELSYADLAETLDVSAGTVASRLNRARTQLRELLTQLGWEP